MYGQTIIEGIAAWDASAEPDEMPPVQYETGSREVWLAGAVQALTPLVNDICGDIIPAMPVVRVGVGFPSSGQRSAVRGECWVRRMATDGINEIILRITLEANVVDILGTLTHEMMHAALDCQDGHSGRFAKACKAFGFIRATDSLDKTPECRERLQAVADGLGTYPGLTGLREATMDGWPVGTVLGVGKGSIKAPKTPRITSGPAKQGTRMVKCTCDVCGFVFRTTRKWIGAAEGLRCPDSGCSGWMQYALDDSEDAD